jgi:hypothetical protein
VTAARGINKKELASDFDHFECRRSTQTFFSPFFPLKFVRKTASGGLRNFEGDILCKTVRNTFHCQFELASSDWRYSIHTVQEKNRAFIVRRTGSTSK